MQKPQLSFVGFEVAGFVEFEFVEDELKPNAIVEIFGLGNTFQIEKNLKFWIEYLCDFWDCQSMWIFVIVRFHEILSVRSVNVISVKSN